MWELKCVFNNFCSLPQTRVKVRNEDRSFCKVWYWIGEGFEPDVLHQSESGRVNCYRRVAQWWGVQIRGHKKLTLFMIPYLSSLVSVKNKFVTTISTVVYLKQRMQVCIENAKRNMFCRVILKGPLQIQWHVFAVHVDQAKIMFIALKALK